MSDRYKPEQAELLQRMADEELAQAEHVEWIKRKVAAARADTRPTFTTEQVLRRLADRVGRYRNAV